VEVKQTEGTIRAGYRLKLILLFCGTTVIVGFYALSHPFVDFLVYWTASHLFTSHLNPYSLPLTLQLQRAAGSNYQIPVVFLCPPWTLTFFGPLGYAHSYMLAWIVWFLILTAAMAVSSRILMDLYFGSLMIPEISYPANYRYLFAFTFYPALLALKMTQISPLILLGLAGFLYFEKKNRAWLAGASLSMAVLKPHLVLLVYLVVLLRKEWRQLAVVSFVTTLLTGVAVYQDPLIFKEYWEVMNGPYPKLVNTGMFAGVRSLFPGNNSYPLQFVPPLIGLIWFVSYWRKYGKNWCWVKRMPVLTLASFFAAPYGFVHDQTILMIPITMLAASDAEKHGKISFQALVIYTALNGVVLLLTMLFSPWCIVPVPIALAILLYYRSEQRTSVPGLKSRPVEAS